MKSDSLSYFKFLQERDKNKLVLALKLYGFNITYEQLGKWTKQDKKAIKVANTKNRWDSTAVALTQVTKIVDNPRGTLKLVILSNGQFALIGKEKGFYSSGKLVTDWNSKTNLISYIREGQWIALNLSRYNEGVITCITDAKTLAETKRWAGLLEGTTTLLENFGKFQELSKLSSLTYSGMVTIANLKNWNRKVREQIAECKKLEKEEERKKAKALKEKITSTVTKGKTKVVVEALDGHFYRLESQEDLRKYVGVEKYLQEMVYQHRYFLNPSRIRRATLWNHFFNIFGFASLQDKGEISLQVDTRPVVTLELKTIVITGKRSSIAYYLQGKRVGYYSLSTNLYNYFFLNKTLIIEEEKVETKGSSEEHWENVRTAKVKKLKEEGIHGRVEDLEGTMPIYFGLRQKGRKWYLVVGEEEIYVKGGQETVNWLRNIITGKALIFTDRYSTEALYVRLSKLTTPEKALKILNSAKEIGRLMQAMGSK